MIRKDVGKCEFMVNVFNFVGGELLYVFFNGFNGDRDSIKWV